MTILLSFTYWWPRIGSHIFYDYFWPTLYMEEKLMINRDIIFTNSNDRVAQKELIVQDAHFTFVLTYPSDEFPTKHNLMVRKVIINNYWTMLHYTSMMAEHPGYPRGVIYATDQTSGYLVTLKYFNTVNLFSNNIDISNFKVTEVKDKHLRCWESARSSCFDIIFSCADSQRVSKNLEIHQVVYTCHNKKCSNLIFEEPRKIFALGDNVCLHLLITRNHPLVANDISITQVVDFFTDRTYHNQLLGIVFVSFLGIIVLEHLTRW